MSYGRYVIYLYDGSFEGLLSAVFDSYANHEIPSAIEVSENGQQTLFYDYLHIPTDFEKSDRVLKKITAVAGQRAAYEMYRSFFANFPDKAPAGRGESFLLPPDGTSGMFFQFSFSFSSNTNLSPFNTLTLVFIISVSSVI